MKPIESFEAELEFKKGKPIFVFDITTKELIHLNKCKNRNFILNVFTQPYYLFYIYK